MNIEDIIIYDIETIKGCFLTCFYIPSENRKIKFLVNENINELDDLVKFLTDSKDKYFVGYNNINFDAQVLEYIVKNYDVLINLPGKELSRNIWQFAQDIIEISNNGGYLPFNDKFFKFKQVDLFKILHGDNKNKIGSMSLKHLEYYMDMIIETFNFDHTSENLSEKEIEDLIYYCEHDVQATYEIYKIVRGNTENTQYKGKDQIGLRLDIKDEFNIECLNYSEAKIGDELFKKAYCEETKVNIKDLPRKGTFRKEIKLKHCIPKYVSFKTPELQSLLKRIENTTLKIDDKFEEVFTFYGTEYTLAQGGIHSTNQFQSYSQDIDTLLEDEDVALTYRRN